MLNKKLLLGQILRPYDIKPFPGLWHEDNYGRRQNRERYIFIPFLTWRLHIATMVHIGLLCSSSWISIWSGLLIFMLSVLLAFFCLLIDFRPTLTLQLISAFCFLIDINFRPQVSGALSGHLLGEAAHRLVKNSLQIRSNNNAGLLDLAYRNGPTFGSKVKPTGPLGYERGYESPNYYQYSNTGMQGFSNSRPKIHDTQFSKQNTRMPESSNSHGQSSYSNTGIVPDVSQLRLENGPKQQPQIRMQNPGFSVPQQQSILDGGPPPPFPPMNWIDKQMTRGYRSNISRNEPMDSPGEQVTRGHSGGFGRQEFSSRNINDKQQLIPNNKVYRVKSAMSQDPPKST